MEGADTSTDNNAQSSDDVDIEDTIRYEYIFCGVLMKYVSYTRPSLTRAIALYKYSCGSSSQCHN